MKPSLPTFASAGYELDNVERRFMAHPETFDIPDRKDRTRLAPGQLVKLIFLMSPTMRSALAAEGVAGLEAERMWVLVGEVASDWPLLYTGTLSNDPFFFDPKTLKDGDTVFFAPEHVADIG